MSGFERLTKLLRVQNDADSTRAERCSTVEPLVARLRDGRNFFPPDQFQAVVKYLLEGASESKREKAMRDGSLTQGRIEIVRVTWLRRDRLVTISDLARITGLPRRTIGVRIAKLNLPCQQEGSRILYDIDMLREVLGRAES